MRLRNTVVIFQSINTFVLYYLILPGKNGIFKLCNILSIKPFYSKLHPRLPLVNSKIGLIGLRDAAVIFEPINTLILILLDSW